MFRILHLTYVEMHAKEVAEKQRQVQNKLLISRIAVHVGAFEIQGEWNDFGHTCQGFGKHQNQFLVVGILRADLETADFSQTLQCHIASFWCVEKPGQKGVDDWCFENVAEWNPVEKAEQCLQCCFDQGRLICAIQDLGA